MATVSWATTVALLKSSCAEAAAPAGSSKATMSETLTPADVAPDTMLDCAVWLSVAVAPEPVIAVLRVVTVAAMSPPLALSTPDSAARNLPKPLADALALPSTLIVATAAVSVKEPLSPAILATAVLAS